MNLTADRLIAACADDSFDAGITINTTLEPLAGPGAPVKPATYEGGNYQHDRRWWDFGDGLTEVGAIVVDNVPSQANRLEAALKQLKDRLGLPEIILDLSGLTLPVHLPRQITSFDLPHRNADAYLRDAELDGTPFLKTAQGKAIFSATEREPEALLEWMPQALLYGFWQSHLGKKRQQTKLARSWVSEIIGLGPASTETQMRGLKGDPLVLTTDLAVEADEADLTSWKLLDTQKSRRKGAGDTLAEIGHGPVPFPGAGKPAALAPVSFRTIVQRSTVAFGQLRRISGNSSESAAAGRAVLAAIGVVAHVAAFGRSFSLRSAADLRPVDATWTFLGADGDEELSVPTLGEACDVVAACAEAAREAGLPVGSAWPAEPLVLEPQSNLRKAIEATWPDLDGED